MSTLGKPRTVTRFSLCTCPRHVQFLHGSCFQLNGMSLSVEGFCRFNLTTSVGQFSKNGIIGRNRPVTEKRIS